MSQGWRLLKRQICASLGSIYLDDLCVVKKRCHSSIVLNLAFGDESSGHCRIVFRILKLHQAIYIQTTYSRKVTMVQVYIQRL